MVPAAADEEHAQHQVSDREQGQAPERPTGHPTRLAEAEQQRPVPGEDPTHEQTEREGEPDRGHGEEGRDEDRGATDHRWGAGPADGAQHPSVEALVVGAGGGSMPPRRLSAVHHTARHAGTTPMAQLCRVSVAKPTHTPAPMALRSEPRREDDGGDARQDRERREVRRLRVLRSHGRHAEQEQRRAPPRGAVDRRGARGPTPAAPPRQQARAPAPAATAGGRASASGGTTPRRATAPAAACGRSRRCRGDRPRRGPCPAPRWQPRRDRRAGGRIRARGARARAARGTRRAPTSAARAPTRRAARAPDTVAAVTTG